MALTKDVILEALRQVALPDGGDLITRDLVRALALVEGEVRFVIEVADAAMAERFAAVPAAAEAVLAALPGVQKVNVVLTAARGAPTLKVGRHPTAQPAGPQPVAGIKSIIAIGSGKGGVGKSTVTANLAVALARAGRRVGLLDADIYGPSQPLMMGEHRKPASPDGKTMIPVQAHGVTMMSLGLLVAPGKAVAWRGPMLMGALQQMLGQVAWGELDVLLVDLPPGTGDVQMTLSQRTRLTGAIVVSTPQDVALIDARKAIDMFNTLHTPVLGLIENMSHFTCPNCGHESHIFGHGGVAAEAQNLGLPLLAQLPIDLETRLAGDAGRPVALGDGVMADAFAQLAAGLVRGGMA
ncbi:Mrp/NBP35 family ATP-binding protein [Ketogulonicigenium vulgare]|uniref:Iron-sulfur cluster carrier protein n=1 Tax=Ketogulonicigenium vulgare (strain WSH-001) TaxID=759362 RepID=F9Y993_KETVW|nr:Mrp/NBP35 family ATP-binding protein [Ketogulonicigenium vulgare]ADO41563.1 Putative Mrp (Multidrug resistance-associated proteins) family protein [Ketogulonicigenium vulgare Y25]AEM41310.1 Septum formation inhibitor-activating ATPase-like protein [Ketogulonicigenium vulgare WSH-001]ALJ81447.1 sodium:proton antiporter [Ketogulonicigenium vulgare]ANW34164.1 sodium:proton antiporter [Ketogulonicigenium vulgare]AOZ55046.1 Mrp (Multidrug resistance-associated proteins) family protein [Ketogulon